MTERLRRTTQYIWKSRSFPRKSFPEPTRKASPGWSMAAGSRWKPALPLLYLFEFDCCYPTLPAWKSPTCHTVLPFVPQCLLRGFPSRPPFPRAANWCLFNFCLLKISFKWHVAFAIPKFIKPWYTQIPVGKSLHLFWATLKTSGVSSRGLIDRSNNRRPPPAKKKKTHWFRRGRIQPRNYKHRRSEPGTQESQTSRMLNCLTRRQATSIRSVRQLEVLVFLPPYPSALCLCADSLLPLVLWNECLLAGSVIVSGNSGVTTTKVNDYWDLAIFF
jgi:hypothetical protein